MHLAAKLGHKTVLSMLLQERNQDNVPMVFTFSSQPQKEIKANELQKLVEPSEKQLKTPLDVAGENGHLGCVHTILDFYYGTKNRISKKYTMEAYVNLACELDSPTALRLILSKKPTSEEIKNAVGCALKMARAECLDVLLRLKPDISTLFGGMNLYHVLYSYSLSFDKTWYETLVTITAVLIRHSQSLTQCVPFRTYPLYSLLAHPSCQDLEKSGPYLISCLLLLLNAGADPNFDEVLLEQELEKINIQAAFGRCAYSNALHCLFDTIGNYAEGFDQKATVRHYMSKCTDALLKHGADLSCVGRVEDTCNTFGNALHCFCRIAPKIGLGEKMLHILLRNGANTDAKVFKYYPLDVFYEELVLYAMSSECSHLADIENSTIIMESMALTSLRESRQIFHDLILNLEEGNTAIPQTVQKMISTIQKEYDQRLSEVWSLKKFCILSIWGSCKRKMTKVMKLPIPKRLRESITNVY